MEAEEFVCSAFIGAISAVIILALGGYTTTPGAYHGVSNTGQCVFSTNLHSSIYVSPTDINHCLSDRQQNGFNQTTTNSNCVYDSAYGTTTCQSR